MAIQADNKLAILAILDIVARNRQVSDAVARAARQMCSDSDVIAVQRVSCYANDDGSAQAAAMTALIADVSAHA